MPFVTKLVSTLVSQAHDLHELHEDLVYALDWKGNPLQIRVPEGFLTDLTTMYPEGDHTPAAVIHDWLYANQGNLNEGLFSRKDADNIFLTAMKDLGIPRYRRWYIWLGVRTVGWLFWSRNLEDTSDTQGS